VALDRATLVGFVGVSDLDRTHAFYGGVLGLPLVESSGFANVYDAGGTPLRVTRVDEPAAAGYTVLGWAVSDIAGTIGALEERGVAFERFPGMEQDENGAWAAPDGSRIAWFRDPDGNILSLQQPGAG
jgi:catechol 2,3-dioxygenase-like lactoylglutathione lyase family enzyme